MSITRKIKAPLNGKLDKSIYTQINIKVIKSQLYRATRNILNFNSDDVVSMRLSSPVLSFFSSFWFGCCSYRIIDLADLSVWRSHSIKCWSSGKQNDLKINRIEYTAKTTRGNQKDWIKWVARNQMVKSKRPHTSIAKRKRKKKQKTSNPIESTLESQNKNQHSWHRRKRNKNKRN